MFPLPDGDAESSIALAIAFASGVGGSLQMSCASFLGSGHRLEFYGDDGTLVLANPTADYFRGFQLMQARRADSSLAGGRDRGRRAPIDSPIPASPRWRGWCSASSMRASGAVLRRPASPKAIACRA